MTKPNFIKSWSDAIASLPMNSNAESNENLVLPHHFDALHVLLTQYGDQREQGVDATDTEKQLIAAITAQCIPADLQEKLLNNLLHFRHPSPPVSAEDRLRLLLRLVHAEIDGLNQLIVAAAEEIHENYDLLCDEAGAGPANLLRRLQEQLPGEYSGYSAGAFRRMESQNSALTEALAMANTMLEAAGRPPVQVLSTASLSATQDRMEPSKRPSNAAQKG